jgi:hydroxymethylglutaryl-CoA synthase
MDVPIGIDSIAVSVPRGYVELSELAEARGVPAGKYVSGLGVTRMAIAGADEDPVTLAANAARRALATSARGAQAIGYCVVGTETAVDHSKPVASYLHGLLGLPARCRVFEAKHACYGATAGLLGATEWLASGAGRGRAALVVATDIARYELGSPGEPTQGAGAVAMVVSERPRLVELEVGQTGAYARDVHDFWRPLHRKEALVDGKYSVQCYLDALGGAYAAWREAVPAGAPLARTCYHVPYGKMAFKAHRHRKMIDGLAEAEADASFAVEVAPSLRFSTEVGNIYTGSLYLALASLLDAEAAALEGRRIGLFSYGSGCGAEFFAGRVVAGAGALCAELALGAPLAEGARRRLSIAEYERVRRADTGGDPELREDDGFAPGGAVIFRGVDTAERRRYSPLS